MDEGFGLGAGFPALILLCGFYECLYVQ